MDGKGTIRVAQEAHCLHQCNLKPTGVDFHKKLQQGLKNLLQSCELVLNINSSQSLMHFMQDPLTLKAAASAIQAGHDDTM